jgi:hypothetical protein
MPEFRDSHEIEQYEVTVCGASDIIRTRYITLKLKPLAHGVEPDVYLNFVPGAQQLPGKITKNNIFNAVLEITLKEQDFNDIYAVLRSEKPAHFSYTPASNWTDPSNSATEIDVTQIMIGSDLEPIGEVEP